MRRSLVLSTGAYLPQRVLTNRDLERMVETTHEWIVERTGIESRHIAAEGELTSDLAAHAGLDAIKNAGMDANSIDLVIVATSTPDDTLPATATKVQHRLGITRGAAFDVAAACSGFVYGLSIADNFIKAGQSQRALVIGAETFSRIVDWKDRSTCILFGDGAAAVVLEAGEQKGTSSDRGVLNCIIRSDGQHTEILRTNGGVSSTGRAGTLFMAGKEVYRHAVQKMPQAVEESLSAAGLALSAVDWVVPHQANQRILLGVAQKLGLSEEKLVSCVKNHANTSAASIPLALHEASRDGRIRQGQLVACPALGAGLTWGCALIRW